MFTGIIDHCGTISDIVRRDKSLCLSIACQFDDLQMGESIAVDGICLTVIEPQPKQFLCEISPETLALTTAQFFQSGRRVNLERALRPADRFGGHFVMGHIDLHCQVAQMLPQDGFINCHFSGLGELARPFLARKACIAINGVSLTINTVAADGFTVMLIPHTLARTNLSDLTVGDKVNIEVDYLARFVLEREPEEFSCGVQ